MEAAAGFVIGLVLALAVGLWPAVKVRRKHRADRASSPLVKPHWWDRYH